MSPPSAGTASAPAVSRPLLGALRLIDGLRERARKAGGGLPLAQLLRAQSLLIALDRRGVGLRPGDLAGLLTALLATSRESQARMSATLDELADTAALPGARPVSPGTLRVGRAARRRRVLIVALALLGIAGFVFVVAMLVRSASEVSPASAGMAPLARRDSVGQSERELAYYYLARFILPALYALVPAIGTIVWLLRPPPVETALRRMTDTGRSFESLPLPPVETGILRGAAVRRAMNDLRRPATVGGTRLDAAATIRATIRSGGAPALRWRRSARAREYVLLCERGNAADHMGLIADAIAARLAGANVAYTRYDFGLGIATVRHAGGRRSGPRSDAIGAVCRRHAGARLIVLGSGESLSRRYAQPEGPGALAELIDSFDTPLLLNITPPSRWGWREAQLQEAGLALFPADEGGIADAVPWLAAAEADAAPAPPRIEEGEDPLIALLHRDALRLASNAAPPDGEVALLIRRLRAYFADVGGLGLLTAIAAFPRIDPAITARLSLLAGGKPVEARLACRLASLPWLRSGRMPDWLIVALLRALGEPERREVRGTLLLLLDDLRAAQRDERTDPLARAARLEILTRSGVARQLLARVGLGGGMIAGESIFVRFLEGAPLDELDQPDVTRRRAPGAGRIVAAGAVLLAGLAAAAWMPALWGTLRDDPGLPERWRYLAFLMFGYILPLWETQSAMLGVRRRVPRWVAGLAHLAGYATFPLLFADAPVTAAALVAVPLGFAAFHFATLIAPVAQAKLPDAAFPLTRIRCAIVLVSLALAAIGYVAQDRRDALPIAALLIVAVGCFAVHRSLWRQPGSAAAITRQFAGQVMLALSGAFSAAVLFAPLAILSDANYLGFQKLLRENYPSLIVYIAVGYLFIAIRFDRRFLIAACFALAAVILLGQVMLPSDYASAVPATFPVVAGAIGIVSAFLVRRDPSPRGRATADRMTK